MSITDGLTLGVPYLPPNSLILGIMYRSIEQSGSEKLAPGEMLSC